MTLDAIYFEKHKPETSMLFHHLPKKKKRKKKRASFAQPFVKFVGKKNKINHNHLCSPFDYSNFCQFSLAKTI